MMAAPAAIDPNRPGADSPSGCQTRPGGREGTEAERARPPDGGLSECTNFLNFSYITSGSHLENPIDFRRDHGFFIFEAFSDPCAGKWFHSFNERTVQYAH